MALFQKSVVNKYLKTLDSSEVEKSFLKFKEFYGNQARLENIRLLKEENYQEGFLREIFVQVLGYTINPDENFNLTTEFKNLTDAKKADGAILDNGKAIGVIELKSTKITSLESITEQAFNYKNHQPDCRYIITSNFEKIRFYIDNATDFEEFNLFTLSEDDFRILYLILSKNSIFNEIPLKLKKESVLHEDNISKQLYQDYSNFKRKIFENLVKNNPQFDKLTLFKKSQKLLDRFLFVLFGEDSGLVPPNAVSKIIEQWKALEELDEAVSLYSRFKKLFHHLDVGHKYTTFEIPAYNGGLFRPDEILDTVQIDDEVLLNDSMKLSAYDFQTEIDVNILGHIFENSLNEIEELTAELEGKAVDKKKTKRKKEGVYYTPKYITKYIVENTVGELCNQKKKELKLNEIDISIIQNSRTKQGKLNKKASDLLAHLKIYSDYLLSLKILDPACGSGAFLNQALEFLINEHQFVDEIRRQLEKDSLGLFDIKKSILENNIFGVDINEESVEIAKLSLWLRTAERGRKLSDLNNNIKCGNSLIDDPEIAGEKAFKWKDEFPEIMAKGGFDVVIGNPPYGATLSEIERNYISEYFSCFNGNFDIYSAFIQLAFLLNRKEGYWGYIMPVSWQSGDSYFPVRKILSLTGRLHIGIKLPYDTFQDAYVDTGIYIFNNKLFSAYSSKVFEFPIRQKLVDDIKSFLDFKLLPNHYWESLDSYKIVLNPSFYELLPKVNSNSINLVEITKSVRGILPNNSDLFDSQSDNFKKYFVGNLYRYIYSEHFSWVKYGPNLREYPKDYSFFTGERILIRRLISRQFRVMATITSDEFVNKKDLYIFQSIDERFDNKYLLAIINSKLISYLKTKGSTTATKDDFSQLTLSDLRTIPIKECDPKTQNIIIENVDKILEYQKKILLLINKFVHFIQSRFEISKSSKKLLNFFDYSFQDFIGYLKKEKIQLSKKEEFELLEIFDDYVNEVTGLQTKVKVLDKTIDEIVYSIYKLNSDEINIIENYLP